MSENRVQFNTIVASQLPTYVREDFPLVESFLKSYYLGQEYQGGPIDLIENIDRYIKLDETTNLTESAVMSGDITFYGTTINVDPGESPTGTKGFPDSYGLLKIDDEIISYTGKTDYSFTGCIRGFVGITSYRSEINKEEVIFEETASDDHKDGATITNLSCLFLKEFLTKAKHQLAPGFENRTLTPELNQNIFVKQAKDFYISKGTNKSFEILFKALYNKDVELITPRDFLFTPSNAGYRIVNQLVVEAIEGDPENLENATLYQDAYKFDDNLQKSYAPITSVEKIEVGYGKSFYKLSYDGGFNRPDGSAGGITYGNFKVEPSTKVIGQVAAGTTVLDVDSTVGFGSTGELYVSYSNATTGIASYTSKSLTQFFGVTGISTIILDSTTVGVNTFTYGRSKLDQSEIIKVRVNSVLNSLNAPEDTKGLLKEGIVNIQTLGCTDNSFKANKWIYNVSSVYKVAKVELIDASDNTYRLTLNEANYFKPGNSASLIISDGTTKETTVTSVTGEKELTIKGQGLLDLNLTYKVQRIRRKAASNTFTNIDEYSTDVENVYKSSVDNSYLVSSPSLPYYNAQPINVSPKEFKFSGTFVGTEFEISPGVEHGFYTGDAIYYSAALVDQTYIDDSGNSKTRKVRGQALFADGLYFVRRINSSTLKFAKSRNDILNSKFVSVESAVTVSESLIKPYEFNSKTLEPQKILRKVSTPKTSERTETTVPGTTGILINGVEILNYKSTDVIRYGKINDVEVLAPGENVDIINPPNLIINDSVGTGATGFLAISGSLREVRIKDPGFDYLRTPTLKIDGGNGQGAIGFVNMKLIDHNPEFFADLASAKVIIGTASTQSRIGFSTYHKFRNAEQVIYRTSDQSGIAGIVTNSTYFVSTIDNVTIRLHSTQADAISGINTVFLTDHGVGKHSLQSVNKKSVVESINVTSGGSGYQTKKRTAPAASGVSTASDSITIANHDYNSGEKVKYTCNGTVASGLSVDTEYYVTVVDKDSFKLSSVGLSSDREFYYRTKQYVDITSVGVGTHIFNYPDITATLVGEVGISSIGNQTFKADIEPIFRGEVTSVHLENSGVGYGSSEIINLDFQPQVTIESGIDAQLTPIVNNGRIVNVIVQNSGSRYISVPDLDVNGDGVGAVLVPVIENGSITSVTVVEPGGGYNQSSTTIDVINAGSTLNVPVFRANLQNWRVNLFEKNLPYFAADDGSVIDSDNQENLQYVHLYAPRKLRENAFSITQSSATAFGESDLKRQNGTEVPSTKHSPILGFAYDGNPIYGPYAYRTKSGGVVTQMKSGYTLDLKANRPSTSIFPEGFFVEDYSHTNSTDESVLDENNGRFCITPDYPEGTYAYFMTVDEKDVSTSGVFKNYKAPKFPYIIGNNYHSIPDDFNFSLSSSADSFENLQNEYRRNTHPYNLIEDDSEYPYIYIPNKLSQKSEITASSRGTISSVGIVTGGTEYRMNENLVFNNTGTGGDGVFAKVSRLQGRSVTSVSVATSSIEGLEIYPGESKGEYILYADNPHNFKNLDVVIISGLSTTSSKIEGSYAVGIQSNRLAFAGVGTTGVAIGATSVTGIVTFFKVTGDLSPFKIRENDILMTGDEKLKVLNVDKINSRIRVLREAEGTTGSSHTIGKFIYEVPRKFTVNSGFKTDYSYRQNEQIYFNPVNVVGLGTTAGVGIGTTITFVNPGVGATQKFIQTKALYIRNHNLRTGDQVTYSPGTSGSGIIVQDETNVGVGTTLADGQSLFVAKINDDLIGIATIRVGLGSTGTFVGLANTISTTLFFRSVGTGDTHSFTTNHTVLTGNVDRNLVTVATAATHGLSEPHNITLNVNPKNTKSITFKYDDYNRRVLVDPIDFTASEVSTTNSEITLTSHGLKSGDKVLHTATVPSVGLSSDKLYYVNRVDQNTIKLSDTYFDSTQEKPVVVDITSASSGTISPINPPIKLYKDSTVTFDLSDSSLGFVVQGKSYPAFELNFYRDKDFKVVWEKSDNSKVFEVVRSGIVGSSGAKVTLEVNSDTPEFLYYKLDLIDANPDVDLPETKQQIVVDTEIVNSSQLEIKESGYQGTHKIATPSTTSFTYTIKDIPEASSYTTAAGALIDYTTDCTHTYGPIAKVDVTGVGRNYETLPGITTVDSVSGRGAILEAESSNIGKALGTRIKDIGYTYPSDPTLSPSLIYPQKVKIEPLAVFDSIGVTSFGKGFSIPPKLVVLDGRTEKLVSDIDLKVIPGSPTVEILKNTKGINNVEPTFIPTQSGAGVGIGTISYDSSTENVTVELAVGFSTVNIFPFAVGDKVLIENVSVGVGSTGKGFNSENYDYKLFELTAVNERLGGIGIVTYSMSGLLESNEIVGVFDDVNSSGRIIAKKSFPIFEPQLTTREYFKGEVVTSDSATGIVDAWNSSSDTLLISSGDKFVVGEKIIGGSSDAHGVASSITSYENYYNLDSSSKVIKGWDNDSGELNFELQRMPDNFYYQNFSYSLKSSVPFETWNEPVSSLNHTLGFKKFSDYQLETTNSNSMAVGLSTALTHFSVVNDLQGFASINCFYDFDLATENNLNLNSKVVSDEIVFANRILTDYFESVGNRVLSIDDISGQFNSNPRSTAFSVVDTFTLASTRFQKYITYVRDKRYTAQRQLMLVDVVHDGDQGYLNQYARVETQYDQGSFEFGISGSDGQLLFYPTKSSVNDYNVITMSYDIDDEVLGTGNTSFGGVVTVNTDSTEVVSGVTTTIVSIAATHSSLKVLVNINPDIGSNTEFEAIELSITNNGSDIAILEYGRLTTNLGGSAATGLGTYHAYVDGANLKVDFIPTATGIGTTGAINTVQVGLATNSITGSGSLDLRHAQLEGKVTSISASGSPGITTVAEYTNAYDGAYFLVQVADTTNNETQLSELVIVDDYIDGTGSYDVDMTEYGNIETASGLGTFGARVSTAGTVSLVFTPNASIDTVVNVFKNALSIDDDTTLPSSVAFTNASITTKIGEYTGTDRDIKREFMLEHENKQIFERYFEGNSSSVVDISANTIKIPDHFFVSGEKLRYVHVGTASSAVGIATTTFVGAANTTFLPGENLFAVKVDDNTIKIASSAENALKSIPQVVQLESVGIGTSHRFISTNQNAKVIVAIDNVIQSPVVSTAVTSHLANQMLDTDNILTFSGITSFFGSDLIKIGDEIMKIEGVGIGSTNFIRVRREWLGTKIGTAATGDLITKVAGNYNIIDNHLNFVEAPFGNTPIGSTTNPPDERDWTGITTSSSFQGRSFIRSGIENTSNESYYKNYIFDNISSQFNATENEFTLKQNASDVPGISTENAIILVNDVFQTPGLVNQYTLDEAAGITTITFQGTETTPLGSDVGISSYPKGGIIVSVASAEGLGYQALVSAGGTAVVSAAGTISSVGVANTGTGYRGRNRYEILTDTSSPVGVGSTEIYLENSNSVYDIISLLNTGNNVTIGVGTFLMSNVTVVSTASTFVRIGVGSTSALEIPTGTQVSIGITNPTLGYVNVSVANSGSGITTHHVGFATIMTGTGNISTDVSITDSSVFYAPRDISNVGYSSITGLTTVTTSSAHGLSFDDTVIVSGIAFTCDYSGAGPVNVTNAVYDNVSGIMTVTTSAAHNLSTTGEKSDVLLTGLGFTCGLDNGGSTHTYPRTTDPVYCGTKVTAVNSSTEFEVNAGVSTVPTFFQSGGTAQPVLIAPRANNNSASKSDPAVSGTNVLRVIDTTTFEINTGISTRKHFYARCGKVNKPLDIVIEDPLSYSNIPLEYSSSSAGLGTHATIDVVVGQGSSVIDFELRNNGYGYGNGDILTVPTGGLTGIPTTSSFSEFTLTVDKALFDKFAGWSLGTLQVLDNVERFIDGARKDFPLTLAGSVVSIVAAKGSNINVQDVLLIFVNNTLQVPGEGYTFTGGSTVNFTEAPKLGDIIEIVFYKGSGDTDVIFRNIIETVKKGDSLQLKNDPSRSQASSLIEDERIVDNVKSTSTVSTNPYFGPGNTNDITLDRPVIWCKQTEDVFVDEIAIGKDRELYEPVINPSAYIIKSVGVGSTAIYVDNLRPMFNPQNENDTDLTFQKKVKFVAQESKTAAAATAIISGLGTISSISISDGGSGYASAPVVTIGSTVQAVGVGTTALATASITAGVVTSITLSNAGTAYTNVSPPPVLIAPPTHSEEEITVDSYQGDNGIIVGFGTTAVGVGTTQLVLDLHIPYDSFLRESAIAGTAITVSSLAANDYFVVRNSNGGVGSTSVTSLDTSGNTVGVGTSFIDNVYYVSSAEFISTSVSGIDTTVKRVFVKVDDYASGYSGINTSDFFGSFSWGRIDVTGRTETNSYSAYTESGIGATDGTGISTSTMVVRSNFLKFKNYIV